MKKCTICDKLLTLANFYKCGPKGIWTRGECKACISLAYKIKNHSDKDNHKVYCVKERQTDDIIYIGCTRVTLHKRFIGHVGDKKFQHDNHYIQLIQEGLSEAEAFKLEAMLIEQYNPKANIYAGYKIHNKALVKRVTNSSDKHIQQIKASNSRPIICLNDGKTYSSIREACKKLGLSEPKVSMVCQGKRPHTKGYMFSYL